MSCGKPLLIYDKKYFKHETTLKVFAFIYFVLLKKKKQKHLYEYELQYIHCFNSSSNKGFLKNMHIEIIYNNCKTIYEENTKILIKFLIAFFQALFWIACERDVKIYEYYIIIHNMQ